MLVFSRSAPTPLVVYRLIECALGLISYIKNTT